MVKTGTSSLHAVAGVKKNKIEKQPIFSLVVLFAYVGHTEAWVLKCDWSISS